MQNKWNKQAKRNKSYRRKLLVHSGFRYNIFWLYTCNTTTPMQREQMTLPILWKMLTYGAIGAKKWKKQTKRLKSSVGIIIFIICFWPCPSEYGEPTRSSCAHRTPAEPIFLKWYIGAGWEICKKRARCALFSLLAALVVDEPCLWLLAALAEPFFRFALPVAPIFNNFFLYIVLVLNDLKVFFWKSAASSNLCIAHFNFARPELQELQ